MADVSFAHVTAEGFTAFRAELFSGEWQNIDTSTYVGADGRAAQPLSSIPMLVGMKLQLTTVVDELVRAWFDGATAKDCDDRWDTLQKRLNAQIVVGLYATETHQREAAVRLQKLLLLGNGEGQTKLKYYQEVDFGRKQVQVTSVGQGAADAAILGLGPVIAEISAATESLASSIAHGATTCPPNKRKRAALVACSTTFSAVYHTLGWLGEFGMNGSDKTLAMALRASLVDLAARYAAPVTLPPKMPTPAKPTLLSPQDPAVPVP